MSEQLIASLRQSIVDLDNEKAKEIAQQSLDSGLDPLDMINQGIRSALDILGENFSQGKIFLPELMLSANAADAAIQVLEPKLLEENGTRDKLGRVLIVTVKGDIHDIGKNIVALLMKSAGFEIIDFGVDKSTEEIYAAAKENDVDVIGLSALLTTTMPRINEFMDFLQESGVRDKYKVILGGAPITQGFADEVGADGYGADASRAVELTKRLVA